MHILKHQHTFQQESALLVNVSLAEELIQIKVSYLMKNNETIGEDKIQGHHRAIHMQILGSF